MLWVGLIQARDDNITKIDIGPVYYYNIGTSEHIGNTLGSTQL